MQIYDVSVPLSATTPTYPGDPGIEITNWLTLAGGDAANVSLMKFGLHSGTHVDAPSHFIEGGAKVGSLPLDTLLGEAEVIEVPHDVRIIDRSFVVENCAGHSQRILFKTHNSTFWTTRKKDFEKITSTSITKLRAVWSKQESSWLGSTICQSKSSTQKTSIRTVRFYRTAL